MTNALRNFLQSASNEIAGGVSAPVDGIAWLLRKAGVPVPSNALMGSDWMAEKGLTAPVQPGVGQLAGETFGLLGPMGVAAAAPQIARGLLKGGENLAAAGTVNRGGAAAQRGIFMGDQSKTWNREAAGRAAALEKSGADPRAIWQETGTFKGPDGKWRQEIDDSAAAMYTPRTGWEDFAANLELSGPARSVVDDLRGGRMYAPEADSKLRGLLDTADGADYVAASAARRELHQFRPAPTVPSNVGDALSHPALYDSYSDLAGIRYQQNASDAFDASNGSYQPFREAEAININLKDPVKQRSTMLHEVQHAIQERQGFARGGNTNDARRSMEAARNEELIPHLRGRATFNALSEESGKLWRAKYISELDAMSKKNGIKPSSVFNQSAWYEHSSKIRDKLGPAPTRAGPERDGWMRSAAYMMRNLELGKDEFASAARFASDLSPVELKNQLRKLDRQRLKHLDAARAAGAVEAKYQPMREMRDFDLYQRLAGEAEARAVQTRMPLNALQRREKFPLDSYDVPIEQLIVRR